MTKHPIGGHIPWAQIDSYLDLVLELGLAPEIAIKGPDLDMIDPVILKHVKRKLAGAKVRPSVHAPFFDLNPGALDPLIRQASCKRLQQALSFAAGLNARLMVIHPGIDKWRYPNLDQAWRALARESLQPLVERAAGHGCRVAIENIYEEGPELLAQLVDEFDSEWFGHCFDAGHWQLFGRQPMAQWLDVIGSRLFHLHLHDNHGKADEHLPVGEGTIDFTPLQKKLEVMPHLPSMTLEAHSAEHLKRSLQHVKALLARVI